VNLKGGGYSTGTTAHSLDPEALGCGSGRESRTIIFNHKGGCVFAETKANFQERRVGMAYGVGDGLLTHAKQSVRNAKGYGPDLAGALRNHSNGAAIDQPVCVLVKCCEKVL